MNASRTIEDGCSRHEYNEDLRITVLSYPLCDLVPVLRALCSQTYADVTDLTKQIQNYKGGISNDGKVNARKESRDVGAVC